MLYIDTYFGSDEGCYKRLLRARTSLEDAQAMLDVVSDEYREHISEWSKLSTEAKMVNGVCESVYREKAALREYD